MRNDFAVRCFPAGLFFGSRLGGSGDRVGNLIQKREKGVALFLAEGGEYDDATGTLDELYQEVLKREALLGDRQN